MADYTIFFFSFVCYFMFIVVFFFMLYFQVAVDVGLDSSLGLVWPPGKPERWSELTLFSRQGTR